MCTEKSLRVQEKEYEMRCLVFCPKKSLTHPAGKKKSLKENCGNGHIRLAKLKGQNPALLISTDS